MGTGSSRANDTQGRVEIAALGIPSSKNGVKFAGEKQCAIAVQDVKENVTPSTGETLLALRV